MKKLRWIAPILLTFFLCACGTEDATHNENEVETPSPTVTQAVEPTTPPTVTKKPTPTPTEEQLAQRYINGLDRIDWKELEGYVDEEDSIRNSNLLNYGYLTYDNKGNIYYVNKGDGKIYASGYKGEDRQVVCENSDIFGWLQLKKDWLYYSDMDNGILRIHLETGTTERVSEKYSGIFFFKEEKIIFEDSKTGFGIMDLDGNNKKMLLDSGGYVGNFTMGEEFWIGEMYGVSNKTWQKKYLVKFNEEKMEILKQRGNFPLLAGKYLSIVDKESQTRHIYNLETKKEIDLKAHTEKAVVSDGTDFYYLSKTYYGDNVFTKEGAYCTISKWDGTSAEEIIKVEGNAFQLYHMFLTPDMLYYQPDVMVDGRQVAQLWYYDLETGETGQIY